ncbi:hypothetical protein [Thermococcus sp. LS2]|uniref:hypothetical protein n=1 Tax=Thermococcus sp. LS2 TaxID=1638260 RepID=UPI001981F2D8|nr:hypothetical protein [Thermococcus sp. LS2]
MILIIVILSNKEHFGDLSIHNAVINYKNSSRVRVYSAGGEVWHRDVLAVVTLYLKVLQSDGSPVIGPIRIIVFDKEKQHSWNMINGFI